MVAVFIPCFLPQGVVQHSVVLAVWYTSLRAVKGHLCQVYVWTKGGLKAWCARRETRS